jgi:hypothetical protein
MMTQRCPRFRKTFQISSLQITFDAIDIPEREENSKCIFAAFDGEETEFKIEERL